MAKDHTLDIVSKIDLAEVQNAVNQVNAEIAQRFDFKGSKSEVTLDQKAPSLTILADSDVKLRSVTEIIESKLFKRGVSIKALDFQDPEKASGDMVRQLVKIQQGIPTDKAKEIVKTIKGLKMKVQASIQEDQVRVTGKKIDDLQALMAELKGIDFKIDMQFVNFR
jgi:hypothetical protein